jgi:hypothetical protein
MRPLPVGATTIDAADPERARTVDAFDTSPALRISVARSGAHLLGIGR